MRKLLITLILTCSITHTSTAKEYAVKPETIAKALKQVAPGDTILLQPGTYKKIPIKISGKPELPITLISASADPKQFAVIDGGSDGGTGWGEAGNQGIVINNSSWIVIENLKFRNCWKRIINLKNCSYITVRGCDFYEGFIVVCADGSHHILMENNIWLQHKKTWTEWDWDEIHHGKYARYNGSLYGGREKSMGASVIRFNKISYAFNGICMWAFAENEHANMEIYGNIFDHINDNSIEPELHTVNLHVYHNVFLNNARSIFSLLHGPDGKAPDKVYNGPAYIYGNVGYFDRKDYSSDKKEPGTVIKNVRWFNPKTPVYFYHNSFYMYYGLGAMGASKCPNDFAIHAFNNAYMFYGPLDDKYDWSVYPSEYINKKRGNLFDYNFMNGEWPKHMIEEGQEKHGILGKDPGFQDPMKRDFQLKRNSPCLNKGKVIEGFTQSYEGRAPDMGAYEGSKLVEGPPFYIVIPKGGLGYEEKPRITRHRVNKSYYLSLFFSWPLKPESLNAKYVILKADGKPVRIRSIKPGKTDREVVITSTTSLRGKKLSLEFTKLPVGTNGQTATMWASTLK